MSKIFGMPLTPLLFRLAATKFNVRVSQCFCNILREILGRKQLAPAQLNTVSMQLQLKGPSGDTRAHKV